MDETIYVILKVLFDFALEVWFSISSACLVWYRKKIMLVTCISRVFKENIASYHLFYKFCEALDQVSICLRGSFELCIYKR